MNNYGFGFDGYNNKPKQCYELLATYLNEGKLGLFLGAGASAAMQLPDWQKLVKSICAAELPSFDSAKSYDNNELKKLIDDVRNKINEEDKFLELVKVHLYKKVKFNFNLAKKELLIALSSLVIGTQRGTIENIITLNFDSVLEWYLSVLGLSINVITKEQLLYRSTDVNITHIHGFLPSDNKYGENSAIIFSDEDFQNRLVSKYDYWKDYFIEFFRRHIFFSIGISAGSLIGDIRPFLHSLDEWYEQQGMKRLSPYGVAFLSKDTKPEDIEKLKKMGIITCCFGHKDIPEAIFEVVQKASKLKSSGLLATRSI